MRSYGCHLDNGAPLAGAFQQQIHGFFDIIQIDFTAQCRQALKTPFVGQFLSEYLLKIPAARPTCFGDWFFGAGLGLVTTQHRPCPKCFQERKRLGVSTYGYRCIAKTAQQRDGQGADLTRRAGNQEFTLIRIA